MITQDSWQRIKTIFQSAQKLSGAERSDFLDAACGDDQSLRDEIEALLTADESNEDFLNAPAYEFAADILVESEFQAGQKIGPYTILCPLGAGGMGQIYLAEDAKLRRKIALKLISQQFASDRRRVERFEQEALAASALNHPNICVIHELGTTDTGRHFIAMEYIQGVTLRDLLSRGSLSVSQALNFAVQIATALASAHASGIIHRDIKPENIMQRPDGYVKVLDFGLAKLTEILPDAEGLHPASTNVRTEAGTLMGTVKYMSPEQLRETKVDDRSDIWSLGVVLYEMLTGATPFEAKTTNDTVAAILASQPTTLSFPDGIDNQLRYTVAKALEKDREARYQTMSKFAADLKELQTKLQNRTSFESPVVIPKRGNEQLTRRIEPSGIFTRLKTQALLTTDFLITGIRSHKTAALFAGATGVLVLLLALPRVPALINTLFKPAVPTIDMAAVTNDGNSVLAAISVDEKSIAHADERNGKQELVITNIETSSSNVVVAPADVVYLGISFTRDNNYLFFTRKENGAGILYRLALPGGTPVKVKDSVNSPISFSPQQDRFAFVRLDSATSVYSLVVSNIDGSDEQVLATRRDGSALSISGLAWSPDGNQVVCPVRTWNENAYQVNLIGFDVKTGREQVIGPQSWFGILEIAWQADMAGLIISARDQASKPFQLWHVTYPEGVSSRITTDLAEYRGVSVLGQKIVSVRFERSWELFVAKAANNFEVHSSILSGVGLSYGVAWAGNQRIVFSSMAKDKLSVWRTDEDGSNRVQLTVDASDNYTPAASADGQFVVFSSNRNGKYNLWRMNAEDGSDLKQLTFTDANFYPSISPDNQWLAFDNQQAIKKSFWLMPLAGGSPTKFADNYRMPAFSPDSQFIASRFDRTAGPQDVAIFPIKGGEPLKRITLPVIEWQRIQWLDDRTLSYVKMTDGQANIWSYDLDTGATKQLTNFNRDQIFGYDWSPDRKSLACQLGTEMGNVVVVKSDR